MREQLRGVDSDSLPEEGGQTFFRGARSHHERHFFCVPEGEYPNWWFGGGDLVEGERYVVYPRDDMGQPYEYHPQGVYVHVHHTGGYATVDQLHAKAQALGYSSPGEVIITDPPLDEKHSFGYLVKVEEAPKPAWQTDDNPYDQEADDVFFRFLGGRGRLGTL